MSRIWSRRRRRRGLIMARRSLVFILVGLFMWAVGFFWFVEQIPLAVTEPDRKTEAIVVLTGGAGRLRTGLELLAQGRGAKLFISGVYRGVEVAEILRVLSQSPGELECCVVLGHDAVDTRSNAIETAEWVAAESISSLRLVTANYHMPRSRVEFRRVMPAVALISHPVFPPTIHIDQWWRWPGSTLLLVGEYNKFLIASAGALWPSQTPGARP